MADYTAPRTWVFKDAITAARLNQDLRDNVAAIAEGGMGFVLDNGYDDLEDGVAIAAIRFDVPVTLSSVGLFPDTRGILQLDIRKCTDTDYTSNAPSSNQSICGDSNYPTLDSNMQYLKDTTLTGYTKDIDKSQVLRIVVLTCTDIHSCFVGLGWTRR